MDLTGLEIQVVVVRFSLTGSETPGFLAPSGAKAKVQPGRRAPGQTWQRHTKNSKQVWNEFCGESRTTFSIGLDGHASCNKLL